MKQVQLKNKNNEKVLPDFITDDLSTNSHVKVPSVYGINKLLENINGVLLWENPLPGNIFGGTTINLDLSKYKFIIVQSYRYNIVGAHIISTIVFIGSVAQIIYADYENVARAWNRHVEPFSTGVLFGDAVINGGIDNYALVPYRIWGFK